MFPWLLIPWFRVEAWEITLPVVGEVAIQPFGILVAAGILLGARIAEVRAKADGMDPAIIADFATYVVPAGLLCAFFLNALFYAPERLLLLIREPSLDNLQRYGYLGLSSYGGFIGIVLGGWLWRRRRKLSLLVAGDKGTYGLVFGWLFGRTGCFIVHDHPGVVTDFFLAVDNYNLQGFARHDLGLYEVLWCLAVIPVLLVLGRRPRRHGLYLGLVPVLYGPVRFLLDFLRIPAELGGDTRYFGLTPAQYGSILFTLAGIAVLWRVYRGPAPQLALTPDAETQTQAPPPQALSKASSD